MIHPLATETRLLVRLVNRVQLLLALLPTLRAVELYRVYLFFFHIVGASLGD